RRGTGIDRLLPLLPRGDQRRVDALQARFEHRVDDLEQSWAAAVVARQAQASRICGQLGATRAKEPDVGVAKAVDRLQLVADGEEVVALERAQDRQLARIGVLELVHHQQLEAARPQGAYLLALAQQLQRAQ